VSEATEAKAPHPLVVIERQLEDRLPEFAKALPVHIPPERFKRVVLTAVQNNPGLLKVERRSFFNACMKAAQDGLLPDGREGAIVEYNDRQRGPIAQWMIMIAGLRKKVRNSGEITDWNAHVVYENDEFAFELGDEPFIKHKPALGERGKPIAAYSVAKFKSGELSREVMSFQEIEKVRQASRAKDNQRGPWVQWWEEMARKTVARRHSKVLPMSTDLDDLIRRDDELYDFDGNREESRQELRRPTLSQALDQIAGSAPVIEHHASETDRKGDEMQPDETSAEEAEPDGAASTSEGESAGADEGTADSASGADDEFPGDKSIPSSSPDFDGMVQRLEDGAAKAKTFKELDQASAELLPYVNGELSHLMAREMRTKVENIYEDNRLRIVEASKTKRHAPQKQPSPADELKDPDIKRGWDDAERGSSKCIKSEIRDNPERLKRWQRGQDLYREQNAAEG